MKATIDRIYGDTARLVFNDQDSIAIQVPASELPRGSREGTVLRLKFVIDPGASDASIKARKSMQTYDER